MTRKAKLWIFVLFLATITSILTAQTVPLDHAPVDPQCVTDDENFSKFFDFLALTSAFLGFLVLPLAAPLWPGITNRWNWTDPKKRWVRSAWVVSAIFFVAVFLPPQLARVNPFFRPFGLGLFHSLGNIRLEYLDCNLSTVTKDYGFFYFMRWGVGSDLMISYWWAQLTVFFVYAIIFSTLYFLLMPLIARRRLEALAR